jgi:hypothetical protein
MGGIGGRAGRRLAMAYSCGGVGTRPRVVRAGAPTMLWRPRSIIPAIRRCKIQPCARPLLENVLNASTAVSYAPVNLCTAVSKAWAVLFRRRLFTACPALPCTTPSLLQPALPTH